MVHPRKVLLIVDDEPGMREMLLWSLRGLDLDIRTAKDGVEAVAALESGPVDVILTDLTMPRANGLELLEAVAGRSKRPAVIMLTGFGTVETAVHAVKKGASDFLLKPCDLNRLIARIQDAMA